MPGALKPAGARTLTLLLLLLRRAIVCDEAVVGGLDAPAGGLLYGVAAEVDRLYVEGVVSVADAAGAADCGEGIAHAELHVWQADEYGVYFFDPRYYEGTEPFHAALRLACPNQVLSVLCSSLPSSLLIPLLLHLLRRCGAPWCRATSTPRG